MARSRVLIAALAAIVTFVVVGCGGAETSDTTAATSIPATTSAPATTAGPPTTTAETSMNIAFFTFGKAIPAPLAAYGGAKRYAAQHNATVTLFDGQFSAPTQVAQIQDATTSGKYQVFIIQANDGTAVIPAVEAAIAKGIAVVAEFTPIGTRYDTAESQVPGMSYVGQNIAANGELLAELGLEAAKSTGIANPVIAYLQGMPALPLDAARTKAAVAALEAGGATVISSYVGGYSRDTGRQAGQDLFSSHPEVNIIIGGTPAILGLETVIPEALKGKVLLIGNGPSTQAVEAVQQGRWYATAYWPEDMLGEKAAEIGLGVARGTMEPTSITDVEIAEMLGLSAKGTIDSLLGVTGAYTD